MRKPYLYTDLMGLIRMAFTVSCLGLFTLTASAAEFNLPPEGPWTDAWTMDLRGEERALVVVNGKDYLWGTTEDVKLNKRLALKGQEFALLAKYNQRQGEDPVFYLFDGLVVKSTDEVLEQAVDGSNFILLGSMKTNATDDDVVFHISSVYPAESDADIVSGRLSNLKKSDFDGRFALAQWSMEQAEIQGNKAFWLDIAAAIKEQTIRQAAADAATSKSISMLERAMNWALDVAKDKELAANLASESWVFEFTDEELEPITSLCKKLNLRLYNDGRVRAWMSPSRYLERTYETRFNAIAWNDADGFYQLGLWAEEHGDILPRSSQLSHKAFHAGLRANPEHTGIKSMMSLSKAGFESSILTGQTDKASMNYSTSDKAVYFVAPKGWTRTDNPIISECDATWVHRLVPTTYIGLTAQQLRGSNDFEKNWTYIAEGIKLYNEYKEKTPAADGEAKGLKTRSKSFTFMASDGERQGIITLLQDPKSKVCVGLRVVYEIKHQETSLEIFKESYHRFTLELPVAAESSDSKTDTEAP